MANLAVARRSQETERCVSQGAPVAPAANDGFKPAVYPEARIPVSGPDLSVPGVANIALQTIQGIPQRTLQFFDPQNTVLGETVIEHTQAAIGHLEELCAQPNKPQVVLGHEWMTEQGAQFAAYCRSKSVAVYVDRLATLTKFYQSNQSGIKALAQLPEQLLNADHPIVYLGEPHLINGMVSDFKCLTEGVNAAWHTGKLTILSKRFSIFSGLRDDPVGKTFHCPSSAVVNYWLKNKADIAQIKKYVMNNVISNEITASKSLDRVFDTAAGQINQANNWLDALVPVFTLLNYLKPQKGSAFFDVGSETLALLNALIELNKTPHFSSAAISSLLHGAIGDALNYLQAAANEFNENKSNHAKNILPLAVMGDTAFVNGGGQSQMISLHKQTQRALIAAIVLNNQQQKIEDSIVGQPLPGHKNGQHILDACWVRRATTLAQLKTALLEYAGNIQDVFCKQRMPSQPLLIEIDLTEASELTSLISKASTKSFNSDPLRAKILSEIIQAIRESTQQQKLHGYACSFFEAVKEITEVQAAQPEVAGEQKFFNYHPRITDQQVFAPLAARVKMSGPMEEQRVIQLIFMNSCFPVRLKDQLEQIFSDEHRNLLPIFVVADTPDFANSAYQIGQPHRSFGTKTVPIENAFLEASTFEYDLLVIDARKEIDLKGELKLAISNQDNPAKIIVIRI